MKKSIIIVMALLAVLIVGCQTEKSTISATGSAEKSIDPDEVQVYLQVSILKDTANDAEKENTRLSKQVVDALKEAGVDENDIETQGYSIYEEYDWTEKGRKSKGWRATHTIIAKSSDIRSSGKMIDVAMRAGATGINYVSFTLSKAEEEEQKRLALKEASESAKAKAQTMAEGVGASLGKIISVQESGFYYQPYRMGMAEVADMAIAMPEGGVSYEKAQILPSDVKITASITVVYEIKS